MITKILKYDNGSHANQSTTPCVIPDGWIEVPTYLEAAFESSGSFCNLTIEDGVLTGIEPLPIPEPIANPTAEITALKAQLTATDYKAIKYAEGWLSEEEYAPIKAQRQSIRDQINALEALNE